jgi:hypothetical protein
MRVRVRKKTIQKIQKEKTIARGNPASWNGARPSDQDTFSVSHRIMSIRGIWNQTKLVHGRWCAKGYGRVRVRNNSRDGVEPYPS